MKKLFLTLVLPWCLLFMGCQAPAQDIPLPMDTELISGKLENGFRYYIRKLEDMNNRGKIQVGLVGRMGYWLEDEKQVGLAHLIEHMIVLTEHSRYDSINAKEWLHENSIVGGRAATYPDKVSYVNTLFREEFLDAYLEHTRAIAWDSLIQKNLLDTTKVNISGRQTVLQESRGWWSVVPRDKMYYLMFGTPKYSNTNMVPDRISLEVNNIKTFDVRDLERYYRDWYRPDMESLIVVGDIPDVKHLESRIKELFSNLKMPNTPKQKSFKDYLKGLNVNLPGTKRVLSVHDANNDKMQARFYFLKTSPVLEGKATTEGQFKNELLSNIYQALVKNRLNLLTSTFRYKGLLNESSDFAFSSVPSAAVGYFTFSIPIENHRSLRTNLETIYIELERIARYGPTEIELRLLKQDIQLREENKLLSGISTQIYADAIENHFIYGTPVMDPKARTLLLKRQLLDVNVNDIQKYARSVMDFPDQVLGFFLPEGASSEGLPSDIELKSWLKEVHNKEISPLKESDFKASEVLLTQEEIHGLSTGIAYKETKMATKGATRLQLQNGLTVILKPLIGLKPQPGQPDIALTGISRLKASDFKKRRDYVETLKSASLVQYIGAGEFDKFAVKRYTEQHKLGLSFGAGSDRTTISGSATAGKEEQLLQLIYLYLSKAGTSKEAFESWMSQELMSSNDSKSNHHSEDFLSKVRKLFEDGQKNGAVEPNVSGEELSQIDQKRSYKRFQQLYSPENLTMVITGNFNEELIKPLILRYLGNLPENSPDKTELNEEDLGLSKETAHCFVQSGIDTTWYNGEETRIYMGWEGEIATPEDIVKLEILELVIHAELFRQMSKMDYKFPSVTLRLYPGDCFTFFIVYNPELGAIQDIENIIRKVIEDQRLNLKTTIIFENYKKTLEEKYQNGYSFESQSPLGMGEYLLEMEGGSPGPRTQAYQRLKMLESINPEAVREAAIKYLGEEKINIIRSLSEKDSSYQ
ncbi:insulinase family protein [Sinomicrobium sp. M5D2P9]